MVSEKKYNTWSIVISFIGGIIIAGLSLYILYLQLEIPDEFYYQNRPNLRIIDTPRVSEIHFKDVPPQYPRYVKLIKREIKDTSNISLDIPFTNQEKDIKSNEGSIWNKFKPNSNKTLFKFDIEFKVVNFGNITTNATTYIITDTLTTKPLLRDLLLDMIEGKVEYGYHNLESFELKSTEPNDTLSIRINNYIPLFVNSQNEFILHIILLYVGYDNRIYDSYFLFKFKLTKDRYFIKYESIYKWHDINLYKLIGIKTYYIPKKPTPIDIIKLEDYDGFYDNVYNKSESEEIYSFSFDN